VLLQRLRVTCYLQPTRWPIYGKSARSKNLTALCALFLVSCIQQIINRVELRFYTPESVVCDFTHTLFIHSLVFSLEGLARQEPEPIHMTGMALAHCILGKFLGVVCHCLSPSLDVPTLATRSATTREILDAKGGILPKFQLPRKFRDLLHAANLRHGTDAFTSPPKEGVLRIFFILEIRRLRPGLNPQTWVLKASTLPLDHRSHTLYPAKIFIWMVNLS